MKKLYVAYGSNLNLEQMAFRCPTAEVYGKGVIKDYKLVFNGVASIEKQKGSEVPVGVWAIDEACERSLDAYEGYPRLYRKEKVMVEMHDGSTVQGMVYIMNYGTRCTPTIRYYNTIAEGYDEIGLDKKVLKKAVAEASKYC